jgi:ABC-2 type transport system permease protein
VNVLTIAWHDLRRVLRARAALFWIFVGPLLFASFFGMLLRPSQTRQAPVSLVNRDGSDYVVRALARALAADEVASSRSEEVAPGRWAVEIPTGAAEDLSAGRPVTLVVRSPEQDETNAERRLVFKVTKALLSVDLQANPADVPRDASEEEIDRRLAAGGTIVVTRGDVVGVRREISTGFQHSVPSYLVFFVFMNLLVLGSGLAEERANGHLRRLFLAPVTKTEIVLGKLLGYAAVGWIQIAYTLAAGVFLFKIRWASHPLLFLAFLTLFAVAAAACGLALGTLFRDADKCRTAAIWSVVLLSPLGGLWWPLEMVGPTMRTIGSLVPTGWAMQAVNGMLAFGAGAREVAPYAAALAALAAAALFVAARRIKP